MPLVNPNDQPTYEVKFQTLNGSRTGWDYMFGVPPVPTQHWSFDDWIKYIGDQWFRLPQPTTLL